MYDNMPEITQTQTDHVNLLLYSCRLCIADWIDILCVNVVKTLKTGTLNYKWGQKTPIIGNTLSQCKWGPTWPPCGCTSGGPVCCYRGRGSLFWRQSLQVFQCSQFFRRAHFCKKTGAFWTKIRAHRRTKLKFCDFIVFLRFSARSEHSWPVCQTAQ